MNTCSVLLEAQATGRGLSLEVKLNNQTKFNQILTTDIEKIQFDFDDSADNHVIEFIMSGKHQEHTILDSNGSIISDRLIKITNVSFDGIILGQLFFDTAIYEHNFNGTGSTVQDKFFGTMGCNGALRLKFTSPVYIWLLENM
jgi:nicotinate-nucleotide pyrophosphorylase